MITLAFMTKCGRVATKAVLLALADHASDAGTSCYPSIELLARKCDLTEQGVRDQIDDLENLGFITVRQSKGGNKKTNSYTLTLTPNAVEGSGTEPSTPLGKPPTALAKTPNAVGETPNAIEGIRQEPSVKPSGEPGAPPASKATAGAKKGSLLDLQDSMKAKEEIASGLKRKHCSRVSTGEVWDSKQHREEYMKLCRQIKELKARIAGWFDDSLSTTAPTAPVVTAPPPTPPLSPAPPQALLGTGAAPDYIAIIRAETDAAKPAPTTRSRHRVNLRSS